MKNLGPQFATAVTGAAVVTPMSGARPLTVGNALGSGYIVTKRERRVSHMYYGIGIGGLIVIVVILLLLF